MKKTMLLLILFIFNILCSQSREYQFKFDAKKFRKEFIRGKKQPLQLRIFDLNGKELIFNVFESSISEQPIQNINTFKGISVDGTKKITFILTQTAISGSYSDKETEVYFNPVINKKCTYKVYIPINTHPGQEQDFLKDR
ncbi:hypothetical protein [Chryseobacterium tongliaoense]|uniref:hypothetical protein n=1 Tax=Chryseobacterium tongliaoense TaxID=3240933 RepID=UPI0035157643